MRFEKVSLREVNTFILGRFFILALIATHINYKAIEKGIAGKSNKRRGVI
ncbi:MAG: hypothetical protein GYA69_05535 [Candidatus Moranbacteria bacterium]|nr:hypothetical protein [Candidatus Moranbacteria bacterium]